MSDIGAADRMAGSATKDRSLAVRAAALLLLFAVVGTVAGVVIGRSKSATYVVDEQVLIQTWSIDSLVLSGQASDLTAEDQADATTIATSQAVLQNAVASLGEPGLTVADLRRDVTAESSPTSHFLTLQARAASPSQATARVQAVANAFVAVASDTVLASAKRLADLPANQVGVNSTAETIRVRAQLVLETTKPVVLYPAQNAVKVGVSGSKAGAAGGIVGLAVGALVVVALSFAPPKVLRSADVSSQLALPGLDWVAGREPALSAGLAADLMLQATRGLVVVCPATRSVSGAAEAVARWLSQAPAHWALERSLSPPQLAGRHSEPSTPRVALINPPSSGLAGTRPDANLVRSLVLVAQSGTPTADVERAIATLSRWRDVDAMIVVTEGS